MERSETRNSTDGGSEIVQQASSLMSCFWCERLHPGEHPLSVCPPCSGRYSTIGSLDMGGPRPLSALTRAPSGNYRTQPVSATG